VTPDAELSCVRLLRTGNASQQVRNAFYLDTMWLLGGVDLSGFSVRVYHVKLCVNRTLKQLTNRFERSPQFASSSIRFIAEQPL